jgi:hypothetical protein
LQCKCIDQGSYICSKHLKDHIIKNYNQGDHKVTPTVAILSGFKAEYAIKAAKGLIKSLSIIRKQTIENSAHLINSILKNLKNCLSYLHEKKMQLSEFSAKALSQEKFDIEFLENFDENATYDSSIDKTTDHIIRTINNAYKINFYNK